MLFYIIIVLFVVLGSYICVVVIMKLVEILSIEESGLKIDFICFLVYF